MKDLSAADEQRILSADPAADVTDGELARSRSRSLAFLESDVTHIFPGDAESQRRPPAKRWRAAGAFLAAAAVAAAVLTASFLQAAPVETPAATETVPPPSPAATTTPEPTPPAGPFHSLFVSADEVLVLEALPNAARNLGAGLGVEPVNVRQVLKGDLTPGETAVDVRQQSARSTVRSIGGTARRKRPSPTLGSSPRTPMAGCI